MTTSLRIEYRIARATLGDSDDEYASKFVDALTSCLTDEFPDAEIDVNLDSDFCNASQTIVSGAPCNSPDDDDSAIEERVHVISNLVWDRM